MYIKKEYGTLCTTDADYRFPQHSFLSTDMSNHAGIFYTLTKGAIMNFTIEEINLMCIYNTDT